MDANICVHCLKEFPPNPRVINQRYCTKEECQRARKAAWKRFKLTIDPEFKENQKLSNKKWASAHPDYWKNYRNKNPKKAERNRMLQSIRNQKRSIRRKLFSESTSKLIAEVDVLRVNIVELPSLRL